MDLHDRFSDMKSSQKGADPIHWIILGKEHPGQSLFQILAIAQDIMYKQVDTKEHIVVCLLRQDINSLASSNPNSGNVSETFRSNEPYVGLTSSSYLRILLNN